MLELTVFGCSLEQPTVTEQAIKAAAKTSALTLPQVAAAMLLNFPHATESRVPAMLRNALMRVMVGHLLPSSGAEKSAQHGPEFSALILRHLHVRELFPDVYCRTQRSWGNTRSQSRHSDAAWRPPSLHSLIIKRLSMTAVLDRIVAATRARVAETRRTADRRTLEQLAEKHVSHGFRRALEVRGRDGVAIIAELKKASPSKGLIREHFHPAELAQELESAGAAALSVLTDEEFFQGSLRNLREASAAVKIPCLRKDFIVDEFQLLEARANCADAVLLIVAALSDAELGRLARAARECGLDVLCEVHDAEELQRAIDAGCDLIGVNTRDLRTFNVDLQTALDLAEKFPAGVIRVAESGIHSAEDVAGLRAAGYDAFLVGESLMRADSPGQALRKLMGAPRPEYEIPSRR